MVKCSFSNLKIKYNRPGGTEVLKSAQSLVNEQAERMAAACNAIAQPVHGRTGQYVAEPKALSYTAGAVVKSADVYAAIDNQRNNTLKKGCGL